MGKLPESFVSKIAKAVFSLRWNKKFSGFQKKIEIKITNVISFLKNPFTLELFMKSSQRGKFLQTQDKSLSRLQSTPKGVL
jgi:hypothetical protein